MKAFIPLILGVFAGNAVASAPELTTTNRPSHSAALADILTQRHTGAMPVAPQRLFQEGLHVPLVTVGTPNTQTPIRQFNTDAGIFIVHDGGAVIVEDYVTPAKEPFTHPITQNHPEWVDPDLFIEHLRQCEIVVDSHEKF